ncbi:MAG: PEP-CTERM sorting domain-containing protein [Alphaproteobacteria bacterium]|jgi:hypothetical protein|nr:PEP-CTERM sorting domain-containing protein [Alphaproteobacteria bacterium]MBN9567975.1 PEP-CTERM sorting domain-containing protein [Alphaproteobacteria bacterium]MBN9569967.1 PEP-CTERM sorting domain-containing protein [Alphaproteobacteria bacterium]OJU55713.1 MAG: hypothetical protein BGO00_13870 [Alphaproteobacteria bacterium 62-8]
MRLHAIFALGFAAAMAFGASASASPITSAPPALYVNGNVKLVYIGGDAGDRSVLSMTDGPANVFCNKSGASCTATAPGTIVDLGSHTGVLNFTLANTTVTSVFDTANTAADGYYHARITADYADLGIFSMPEGAATVIDSLLDTAHIVYYIGFEDRMHGDYDYNDFVFALIDPPIAGVPEPLTISLLGAGLLGLGFSRHKARA